MFKKITVSAAFFAVILLAGASVANAGTLTPPGAPADTMYTLTNLYNLAAGTTATLGSGTIPATPGTVAATFYDLTQIYNAIAGQIAALASGKIASGVSAFGYTGTLFGDTNAAKVLANATYPGTIPVKTGSNAVTGGTVSTDSLLLTPPLGYYDGTATVSTTSPAFIAGNIKSGTNLFGIIGSLAAYTYGDNAAANVLTTATAAGTYNAANLSPSTVLSGTLFGVGQTGTVIKSLGNAVAANVLSGTTFSNATGANISGTMPTNTLSSANDTVAAGYYAATALHTVDPNLAAGNIKTGTSIFGIAGSFTGTSAKLLKTNQTICYDATGAVIACTGTGQDGELQTGVARSYTDNANGTITDNNTGLVWQKQDNATLYTWANALTYCNANTAALPGTGWRLPNVYELYSLVDFGIATAPYINLTYFPATQSNGYWSSTTYPASYSNAMNVFFNLGSTYNSAKTNTNYVRCVRG